MSIGRLQPITIDTARADDLPVIRDLLMQSGLPLDGVGDPGMRMLVARDGLAVVGSVGLELYGHAALLRSLAVDAPLRGHGLGVRLTRAALALARDGHVRQVYVLTETADDFFR